MRRGGQLVLLRDAEGRAALVRRISHTRAGSARYRNKERRRQAAKHIVPIKMHEISFYNTEYRMKNIDDTDVGDAGTGSALERNRSPSSHQTAFSMLPSVDNWQLTIPGKPGGGSQRGPLEGAV